MHNKDALEMMGRCVEEITQLRRRIDELAPKAEAYDMIRIMLLGQPEPGSMGEDVVWQLENRIRELEKEEADLKAEKGTAKAPTDAEVAKEFEDMLRSKASKASEREKAMVIAMAQGDELVDERMAAVTEDEKRAAVAKARLKAQPYPPTQEGVTQAYADMQTVRASEALRTLGYD